MPRNEQLNALLKRLSGPGTGATLVRGSGGGLFVNIGGAGLAFVLNIVLARVLTDTPYGVYVYALAWINVLALIAKSGMDTLLIRFVPAYRSSEDWPLLRGLLRFANRWVIAIATVVALLTVGIIAMLDGVSPELKATFYAGAPLIVLLAIIGLPASALRGFKHIVAALSPHYVFRPLLLIGAIGAWFVARDGLSPPEVMLLHVTASAIAVAASYVWLSRKRPAELATAVAASLPRQWLAAALPMLLISGMHVLLRRVDVIMLGAIAGTTDAGFYNAATRIANLVTIGLVAVNSIAAPLISELYSAGEQAKLQRMIRFATRGILLLTAGAGIVLVVLGKFVLALFGASFVAAFIPLMILVGGQVVNATAGPTGFIMTMTGRHNQAAIVLFVTLIANVALNALLIPDFGMNGAAAATAASTALWNSALLIYIWRKLRLNPLPFGPVPA